METEEWTIAEATKWRTTAGHNEVYYHSGASLVTSICMKDKSRGIAASQSNLLRDIDNYLTPMGPYFVGDVLMLIALAIWIAHVGIELMSVTHFLGVLKLAQRGPITNLLNNGRTMQLVTIRPSFGIILYD